MKVFYDTEFVDDGEQIHLISIGMVNEAGDTYYAVNSDMPYEKITDRRWLMVNVAPHLPHIGNVVIGSIGGGRSRFNLDTSNSDVKPKWVIRNEVRDWLHSQPGEVELWAWYSAYDHVALAQLFGPMSKLPIAIPMFTNDIRTLQLQVERVTGRTIDMPQQPAEEEHHALNDAGFDKVRYEHLRRVLVDYRDSPAVLML